MQHRLVTGLYEHRCRCAKSFLLACRPCGRGTPSGGLGSESRCAVCCVCVGCHEVAARAVMAESWITGLFRSETMELMWEFMRTRLLAAACCGLGITLSTMAFGQDATTAEAPA